MLIFFSAFIFKSVVSYTYYDSILINCLIYLLNL